MTNLLLFFFVLCYVLDSTVLARTHYEVLGVRKDVFAPELKKTYRKLAKEWHPDRHQNAEKKKIAEKKFMEISEAYETLADEEKRRDYDDELRGGSRSFPRGARSGAGFGGFGKGNTMEDMFSSFFGGGSQRRQKSSGFSFSSRSKRQRPTSWDFGSLSRFSNLEVLGKDEILNTLGKSFRGNSNYLAVFLDTTTMSKDTQMQILTKLDSFQSKSAPLTKTVLIDCINKPHSVCKKYSSKDSMNTKFFSDMSEDAHSITSPSDVKKIYKDFIDKIPPATLIDLKNHEDMITTVRSCLKNTKNTLGCAFLVVDDDMKSWKLKAAAEMLKSRADLFIVRRDKMGTNLLRSLIGLSDKDSNLYVYKNTVLNKADVRLDNLKGFKLDLSNLDKMPLTDLKPQLTRDIWK